ncbi:unnamed protein product, partial [Prorocentrum cordatum]
RGGKRRDLPPPPRPQSAFARGPRAGVAGAAEGRAAAAAALGGCCWVGAAALLTRALRRRLTARRGASDGGAAACSGLLDEAGSPDGCRLSREVFMDVLGGLLKQPAKETGAGSLAVGCTSSSGILGAYLPSSLVNRIGWSDTLDSQPLLNSVPNPYPGVQYRKSKNIDDRYQRYAETGATVRGQIEDNGEWLRISRDVFLPMRVGTVQILEPLARKEVQSAAVPRATFWGCCTGPLPGDHLNDAVR